jgi:hypothetical protein
VFGGSGTPAADIAAAYTKIRAAAARKLTAAKSGSIGLQAYQPFGYCPHAVRAAYGSTSPDRVGTGGAGANVREDDDFVRDVALRTCWKRSSAAWQPKKGWT